MHLPAIRDTCPEGETTKVLGVPPTFMVSVALKQVSPEMVPVTLLLTGTDDAVLKVISLPKIVTLENETPLIRKWYVVFSSNPVKDELTGIGEFPDAIAGMPAITEP